MSDQAPRTRDPLPFVLLATTLSSAVVALALYAVVDGTARREDPWTVAVWVAFCAVANILPVPVSDNVALSLSSSATIAMALVFPLPVAGPLVFVAAVSEWEVRRDTTVLHAVYNRAQMAMSAVAAAAVFELSDRAALHPFAALCAMLAHQATNLILVALADSTCHALPFHRVIRRMVPKGPAAAAAYLFQSLMGIVLALTYLRVGGWAVAVLMIPLLGGRFALRAARQLESAERDRRRLSDQLIDERERERARIGSDIHDGVLQQLAAIQMQADTMGSALDAGRPDAAAELARKTALGIETTIADLRAVVRSLRRTSLDAGGLPGTLKRLGRSFHAASGVEVAVECDTFTADVPLSLELLLCECCEEALTNVARHAAATAVCISLSSDGNAAELTVADNGVGPAAHGSSSGLGLVLARDKVNLAGGGVWLEGKQGQGTVVRVRLPIPLVT
ncbi:MAG TPA: histidine kinase [Acidimicrobiales bacterium]|nr:histidine kinase [Acidimicrobiales bacterium]